MGKHRMYTRHLNDGEDEVDVLGPVRHVWGFGFVHNIDFHHWRSSLKRILLQKINPRKRLKGKTRAKELDHVVAEQQKLLNKDEILFHNAKDSGMKQKRSLKARIKALISEENGDHWCSNEYQPKLNRTYSIHHLEPPDPDWESPIFFFSNEKDTGPTKLWDLKNMNVIDKPGGREKRAENKEASKDKDSFLAIFKASKNLFLDSLQDTDTVGLRKSSLPGSRARLTKSGSYPNPASQLFHKRDLEPNILWQKQSDIWPAPKGDKLKHVTIIPKADKFNSSMHIRSKSLPSEYRFKGSKLGQALDCILETSAESDERKNEENRLDKEGPACRIEKESPFSNELEGNGLRESTRFHRRSSSLNDSLEKYARLFGNDLGKDVNLASSRSLKLRNEYETGLGGGAPIMFGRIGSLSHLESYSSIGNVVHGHDPNLEELPITTDEESIKDDCGEPEMKHVGHISSTEESVVRDGQESNRAYETPQNLDSFIPTMANLSSAEGMDSAESVAEAEDQREEADSMMVVMSNSFREQEISIAPTELAQACSIPAVESSFREEVSSNSVEFQDIEGLDYEGDHYRLNSQEGELSGLPFNLPNLEKPEEDVKKLDTAKPYGEIDDKTHENTDLDYVEAILEHSGFGKDALEKTWYSSNQPLGPSVFFEMEAYWHNKELQGCYHHQLLFDIINEKLLNIYDRSFAYYPKALSSSCHIHPFPIGDNMLYEICKSIGVLTDLKPEQKQSLECIVGLDMAGKDDGWMNLQMESECLALELEELIFEELMEDMEDMIFEEVFGS